MANPEHLKILRQGIEAWNQWRQDQPQIHPDLREANLDGEDSRKADLSGADLSGAILNEAKLCGANLSQANLSQAKLIFANLFKADLSGANLSQANFSGANLSQADLSQADLSQADLPQTNLSKANLSKASFSEADLFRADLSRANLSGANLSGTILQWANFHRASLREAVFSDADLSDTVLTNTDLSEVKGLESVIHHGPSSLGINTFLLSKGKIPDAFLRGAGVPDSFIRYAALLNGAPFEFYTCFISHSTEDEEFATRLYNDFQANGIRCWKWDRDARTGRSLLGEIDRAIRDYDKLVLIASESSLKSPAVNREIERALVQEDERLKRKLAGDSEVDCDVLFPVRLDDFILKGWEHERKADVTKKFVADACGWASDPPGYRRMIEKLLRDLQREKSKPSA